jgi:hypothetical protein
MRQTSTRCYALLMLPDRRLVFRAGFRSGKHQPRPSGRPSACRRAVFVVFPNGIRSKFSPEARFPARKKYCLTSGTRGLKGLCRGPSDPNRALSKSSVGLFIGRQCGPNSSPSIRHWVTLVSFEPSIHPDGRKSVPNSGPPIRCPVTSVSFEPSVDIGFLPCPLCAAVQGDGPGGPSFGNQSC